jgi:hypothetical protein
MVDYTGKHGVTFTLTDEDRLLMASEFPKQDGHGIAISRTIDASGKWLFDFGNRQTLYLADNAALRKTGEENGLFVYTTVDAGRAQAEVVAPTASFRNGTSLSNSQNGYYEDVQRFVAPYVIDGGAKALRIPIKRKLLWQNGVIQDSITLGGYATKQFPALCNIIDFAIAQNVAVVIDDHTYSAMSNAELLPFWTALGQRLKAKYGSNDLIHLELQNETSGGGWDTAYATGVRDLVQGLRAAGIDYPLIVGWGGWNSIGGYTRALTELDTVGGAENIDPLGKLQFSAHHYPTTTGNDLPTTGQNAPQIKGSAVSTGFVALFDEFKRRGLKIWITEIGLGGGARAWLANGSNVPAFTGKEWLEQFTTIVAKYPGTVAGVLGWGGGSAWADTYPFKQEYAKDNWTATKSTEFWRVIKNLWAL